MEDPLIYTTTTSLLISPELNDWQSMSWSTSNSPSPSILAPGSDSILPSPPIVTPILNDITPSAVQHLKQESPIPSLPSCVLPSSGLSTSQLRKHQQHKKNSAARCRGRLNALLESLWETVPEEERIRLRRRG